MHKIRRQAAIGRFVFYLALGFSASLPVLSFALPMETDKRFYRPYGDVYQQTKPKAISDKTEDAYCDASSLLSNRPDVRRCRLGQISLDPCFLDADKPTRQLKCITSPWSKKYRLLQDIAKPRALPEQQLDLSKDWPWGIELIDGVHCLRVVNQNVANSSSGHYRCENQGELFGYLQHCKEPWSMLLKKRDGSVVSVALKRVWF